MTAAFSQEQKIYKFRNVKASYRAYDKEKKEWGTWTNHNNPALNDILIVVDVEKKKVSFYAPERNDYDIIEFFPVKKDDKKTTISFKAVDPNNRRCDFSIIYPEDRKTTDHFLFQGYSDFQLMFLLKDM